MKYDKVEKQSVAVQNDSIECALADGEEILWQGKPKKSAYIIGVYNKQSFRAFSDSTIMDCFRRYVYNNGF